MLPVVAGLGFWQLERAAEKQALEDGYFDRMGMLPVIPPARLDAGSKDPLATTAFLRVKLAGHYEADRHFLLDNQIRKGVPGYGVISSFRHADGRRFLINRGFMAATGERSTLPEVPTPEADVVLIGALWPDLGLLPLLKEDLWPATWPKRVQRRNLARMADQLHNAVALEVRLERGQPGVFVAPRVDSVVSPAKHLGYAVQWFGLALVLVVGFTIYGFRRNG